MIAANGILSAQTIKFRHVETQPEESVELIDESSRILTSPAYPDSLLNPELSRVRDVEEILASTKVSGEPSVAFSLFRLPTVFIGYRHLDDSSGRFLKGTSIGASDVTVPAIPEWLENSIDAWRIANDAIYRYMTRYPKGIMYSYRDLPEPPQLKEDDTSFKAFLRKQKLPEMEIQMAGDDIVEDPEKRHWLHQLNGGVQFSQAYLSPNWYQGGNNHLALLVNFLWDVTLNQVYHPNLMFNSNVSYKLGLNSTPQDKYHDYSISEDLFQWNLRAGVKAFDKWFYSFTLQAKTQFLNSYPADSWTRTASILSPGELNVGLGMTYSTANAKNTCKFNASIAPISYNLKTCIDSKVDPVQFNIPAGRKLHNGIGSNAELTLDWKLASNINYKSRLFAFTNYQYFQGDWENTFSFNINRFLSTQLYVHLRYDSSSEISDNKWKHWMLKEILSFGFAYSFNTKS